MIVRRIFRIKGIIDFLISCFLIYLAQIIISELALGILGRLYLKNIILVQVFILAGVWLSVRRDNALPGTVSPGVSLSGLLRNKLILAGASLILGFALVKISINLVNPPFGWDSLNYHFSFPVEWIKNVNLNTPITVFDDPAPSYYPINGSLFFLWLIFPLRSVFLADLGQVPFFILGFLSIYSLGRKLELSREYALLAACLFTLIPNYFKQLEIAYVDVMVSGLFFAAINFLFALKKDFSLKDSLLFGLSLGLLIGTKTVALPFALLLVPVFLYLALAKLKKFYLLLIVFACVVFFGGFSYIRNLLDTGNPLYPIDIRLMGFRILKGVVAPASYGAHFRPEDYRLSKLLFHEGLGVQTIIFILPSMFLALPSVLRRKRKSLDFSLGYFLILPLLLYLVYRFVIPLANARYLYSLLGVGMICAFYTFETLKVPKRVIRVLVAVCLLASISELASHWELVSSLIISALVAAFLWFSFKQRLVLSLFVAAALVILPLLEGDYIRNEFPRYISSQEYSGFWPDATSAWKWLNQNTQGNNIAYAGRPVPFPLYGTNFKNNVYYASVNRTDPAKLHYFPEGYYRWGHDFISQHQSFREDGNYRGGADYRVWLENLDRRGTDYVFIYSLHQTEEIDFPIEEDWAREDRKRFTRVFTNATVRIYKLKKG
ncbi:hypothetical protein ACFLZ3_01690 [Candidatus Omnitrophota bacterium]